MGRAAGNWHMASRFPSGDHPFATLPSSSVGSRKIQPPLNANRFRGAMVARGALAIPWRLSVLPH